MRSPRIGLLAVPILAYTLSAQAPLQPSGWEWRRIGSLAVSLDLASPATGPVDRVWYAEGGDHLVIRTRSGAVWETADGERWRPSTRTPPPRPAPATAARLPEPGSLVLSPTARGALLFALGRQAHRSEDGGRTWTNLTAFQRQSILGGRLADLAVSPRNPDEAVVAGLHGVWRSVDGGTSWVGLNRGLPNLPVTRILDAAGPVLELEWPVADSQEASVAATWRAGAEAWEPTPAPALAQERSRRQALSRQLGQQVVTVAAAGPLLYAGTAEGWLHASSDGGRTWRSQAAADGASVTALWVDSDDPRHALATLAYDPDGLARPSVLRTVSGGDLWYDLTQNLPAVPARGVAAHHSTGTLYIATDAGLYTATVDAAAAPSSPWTRIGAELPSPAITDVRLDAGGHQLYVALAGHGIYATLAPHRLLEPAIVSAGDNTARPAAPGSLLSVLGLRLRSARVGEQDAPILATTDSESQLQVPFDASGDAIRLSLGGEQGDDVRDLPLKPTSPSIVVDRDNLPLLLEAETGAFLDGVTPARSGSRIQIFATGLGRVQPDWPTGMPAPLVDPPSAVAPVRAFLDREPVEVTRATLAPGHIGFYLVEIVVPRLVNAGPAELYLEAGGQASNRIRVLLQP